MQNFKPSSALSLIFEALGEVSRLDTRTSLHLADDGAGKCIHNHKDTLERHRQRGSGRNFISAGRDSPQDRIATAAFHT